MKQRMRSLGRKIELATYANDKLFTFTLKSKFISPDSSEQIDNMVCIPVPIMYRFYYIGRAYDLHQLKNLQPTGRSFIDFLSIQFLVQELEQITELIDDPVLQHYSSLLVPYLKAARADTTEKLILDVAAG